MVAIPKVAITELNQYLKNAKKLKDPFEAMSYVQKSGLNKLAQDIFYRDHTGTFIERGKEFFADFGFIKRYSKFWTKLYRQLAKQAEQMESNPEIRDKFVKLSEHMPEVCPENPSKVKDLLNDRAYEALRVRHAMTDLQCPRIMSILDGFKNSVWRHLGG